ncbi:hypothetical protein [Winogradskyella sp. MIT101101]|uniref:hypothetical protein n=1 Tax=Winogradskyella sp. MIT101101 TaxID=3098297 RepID=UPI00399A4E07
MINLFRKIRKDMFKKKSFLSYLLYAIGEIVLIVVGILLALYLQNKNEEKKIEKNVSTSINMLKDEIMTNKQSINRVKDYHIMVRDSIDAMDTPKNEEDIDNTLSFWRGMQTPRLQNAAFQTSIQSGVGKEIHPELLKSLNALYTYQDSYNAFGTQATQIFFNADFTDYSQFKRIMTSIGMTMTDLYWYERELTEMFDYNIRQINSLY